MAVGLVGVNSALQTWVQIPSLPLSHWVTVGRLPHLSELQVPSHQMAIKVDLGIHRENVQYGV